MLIPFSRLGLALMSLVVGCELYHPIPSLQRLATTRLVFLSLEGFLVRGDLRDILGAGRYCCRNSCEARACCHLISARRSGTLHFLAQVQAVAVRVRGSRTTGMSI